jgi:uncharacterized protein (TIGR02147 family)
MHASIHSAQSEIVQKLHRELHAIRERRENYSLRQFARRIGVQSPVLIQVLNGKRTLTRRLAHQLLSGIRLETREIETLLARLPEKQTRRRKREGTISSTPKRTTSTVRFKELATAEWEVVSDWWFFAIQSLARTRDFISKPESISRRLGLPLSRTKKAISTLLETKLLERGKDETLRATEAEPTTSAEVPNLYIRKNHIQGLDLASEKIHSVPLELRDYSSMTFEVDPDRLEAAKEKIQTFRRELAQFLGGSNPREVYRMQIQLFPLTQLSPQNQKSKTTKTTHRSRK